MYIKREVREEVCILSFNKPEVHNAFDDEASAETLEAFEWARDSKDFRVVLLRGEGRSFCAGRDVRAMGERKPGVTNFDFMREGQQIILTLLDLGKPLIADFRVASTDLKFALPEVKYSLTVDQGGSLLASTLIGPARTKYLLMTGDTIDAATAYDWGLVDFLVDPQALDEKAFAMAAQIAKNSRQAVLAAKTLVDEDWSDKVRAAIRRENTAQLALFASEEFLELREKRRAARAAKAAGG
jgi:enoyl-CoA hydratase/carnithine racemase